MNVEFDSNLFGISDNQSPNPFPSTRSPSFSNGKWRLDCALGECGMTVTTREINSQTYLVFGYSFSTKATPVNVNDMDIYMRRMAATVEFECAYRNEVKVSSEEFSVHAIDAAGKTTNFGSLEDGFTLSLFTDTTMTTAVDASNLFIGRGVFAKVDWTVRSLSTLVNFYLDSCDIEISGSKSLRLIDRNCYANTFSAKQLQPNKVVAQSSRFCFTSFIVGSGARTMKMQLTCNVKVCSVKENKCQANLSTTDSQCKQNGQFGYRANTYVAP